MFLSGHRLDRIGCIRMSYPQDHSLTAIAIVDFGLLLLQATSDFAAIDLDTCAK